MLVGLLNALRLNTSSLPAAAVDRDPVITASYATYTGTGMTYGYGSIIPTVQISVEQAMRVPAVARSRNILCGSIATIPLESYNKLTDQKITNRTLITQPDPAIPRVNTMAMTIEDLIFYGVAYWQVMDVSPEDGRPYRARRIDPRRVLPQINYLGTLITGYQVDSKNVPNSGLNSLIVFNAIEAGGVLARSGTTIRTALELEDAAYRMAAEPVPTMVITNEGMNATPEEKASLLDVFRQSRRERSTAYIEGPLKLDTVGFNSAELQLVEARQHLSSEIARLMGIPAWYLNAENSSATYSNVASERRSLVDFGLRNYLSVVEDRLSMDDVTPRNQVVRFDLDDFLRGNTLERVEMSISLYNAGIINREEARYLVDIDATGTEGAGDNGITPPSQTQESPIL
jgi:HK97 family phage portal protein